MVCKALVQSPTDGRKGYRLAPVFENIPNTSCLFLAVSQ